MVLGQPLVAEGTKAICTGRWNGASPRELQNQPRPSSSAPTGGVSRRKPLNCICMENMAKKKEVAKLGSLALRHPRGSACVLMSHRSRMPHNLSLSQPFRSLLRHAHIFIYIAFLWLNRSVNLITHFISGAPHSRIPTPFYVQQAGGSLTLKLL